MPLEYDSAMSATEAGREASWAMYQGEREKYSRKMGPRGPRFMPIKEWKKRNEIVDKPVMLTRIEALPALTQARVLTELQNDPGQVANIKRLLAEPDPAAAIIQDQEKAALNVVKPGLFPEAAGKWPVYQQYYRKGYAVAIQRAAQAKAAQVAGLEGKRLEWNELYGIDAPRLKWQAFHGIDGLGVEISEEALKALQAKSGTTEEKKDDWSALLKTASSLVVEYGVPALKANVNAYAQKKEGKKEGALATKAMKLIEKQSGEKAVEEAKAEQIAVQAQVAPTTSPPPRKAMSTGTKLGIGVGALLLAGFAGWLVLRKK